MDFNLNRYKKNIEVNTPHKVIIAWMACCGKNINETHIEQYRDHIIDFLENYEYILPPQKAYYSADDYNKIVNFVSPEISAWKENNLLRAMQHIIDFDQRLEFVMPSPIGNKKDNNIFACDIIMLYNYCVANEIEFEIEDDIDDLLEHITKFQKRQETSEEECIEIIKDNVDKCDKDSLWQIMDILPSHERKEKEEVEPRVEIRIVEKEVPAPVVKRAPTKIEDIKNSINLNYMIARSQLDENEALVYGAKFLAINLYDSEHRVSELMEFNRCKMEDINYTPLFEDKFGRNYNLNRYYYRMDHYWHPDITDLYPQKTLALLLRNEGLKSENGKADLEANFLTRNFYLGLLPGMEDKYSFVYKHAPSQIEKHKIISYGVRESEDLIFLTTEEIIAHFKNHQRLADFHNNEDTLSSNAVKKLLAISKTFTAEDDYHQIIEMIEELKDKKNNKSNQILEDFKNKYLFSSEAINKVLLEIFYLSMYIRGWKINDLLDYPLKREDCLSYSQHEKKIEDNVRISIKRVNTYINNIVDNSTKNIIYKLPLMKYNKKENNFFASNNKEEGLTIHERIKIMEAESENVYACLRLSSNHLATSAYYYYYHLTNKKLFDLNKLETIQ